MASLDPDLFELMSRTPPIWLTEIRFAIRKVCGSAYLRCLVPQFLSIHHLSSWAAQELSVLTEIAMLHLGIRSLTVFSDSIQTIIRPLALTRCGSPPVAIARFCECEGGAEIPKE